MFNMFKMAKENVNNGTFYYFRFLRLTPRQAQCLPANSTR
jgi:hypothetical protein